MHISNMMMRVTALFFTALMANFAVACDTCLVHKALPVVPLEDAVVLAQPSILPTALVAVAGVVLVFAVAYGVRRVLVQKELAQKESVR